MATAATNQFSLFHRPMPAAETSSRPATDSRWVVVLAGGDGPAMQPFINKWLGDAVPKQYCTFVGSRSMIQHTLDRACSLVPAERVVTVLGHEHRPFLARACNGKVPGRVVEQPVDRGSAMGIFLGATYVFERDPHATMVILPSDNYIAPEKRFLRYVEHACRMAEHFDDQLILLGAQPDRPETEYGWIEPRTKGWVSDRKPMSVKNFHENPRKSKADGLIKRGCLWNTNVMVVKVRTLWAIGWQLFPDVMRRFEIFRQVLGVIREDAMSRHHEEVALAHIYRDMKEADFSREVLQYIARWSSVLPMEKVEWSDWGRPDRLRQTIERVGLRPTFPVELLNEPRRRRARVATA